MILTAATVIIALLMNSWGAAQVIVMILMAALSAAQWVLFAYMRKR